MDIDRPKPKKKNGCLVLLIGGTLISLAIGFCSSPPPSTQTDSPLPPNTQASTTSASTESAKTQAAPDPDDAAGAALNKVSLAVYLRAKDLEIDAYSECLIALENAARYTYKTDWTQNYIWVTDGKTITIRGRDLHLQNGFGAYSNEPYLCQWDIATKTLVSYSAE